MAAGAGAPAPRLPIGTFEISAVTLRPPSARFFLALRPLRDGWVSFERWCACRSAVSRWIPRPRQRPAGSLLMLSGRSPGSADRFARIGFRAQRVTTMRCKRRSAQAAIFSCKLGVGQERLSKRFLHREARPISRQWRAGRFLGPFRITALALGYRRAMQGSSPGRSDNRCILRERLARWTKRLLRYRPALMSISGLG